MVHDGPVQPLHRLEEVLDGPGLVGLGHLKVLDLVLQLADLVKRDLDVLALERVQPGSAPARKRKKEISHGRIRGRKFFPSALICTFSRQQTRQ